MHAKSILITGCSSGIGLATAKMLKERGYLVFASARKETDVKNLRSQGFQAIQLDVTHQASMQQALTDILQQTGGTLDALFNNAGYMQAGAVEDLTRDLNHAQFETNVFGPIELIRLVLPIMRKQGHGRIIQNSSILGVVALPYYGSYCASKFALEGFSHSLRQELRGTNIHVSLINPGPTFSKLRETGYQIYQQTLKQRSTPVHQEIYDAMEQYYFNPEKSNDRLTVSPEVVSKKVLLALESSRPKAHYFVGVPTNFLAFLRRLLPDCALDWILVRINQKGK